MNVYNKYLVTFAIEKENVIEVYIDLNRGTLILSDIYKQRIKLRLLLN